MCFILSWIRSEKDQLEEQLKGQQAEAKQLQEKLTEEQKVRTSLETVLAQATSLLRDIIQVSSGRHQRPADQGQALTSRNLPLEPITEGLFPERLMARLLF